MVSTTEKAFEFYKSILPKEQFYPILSAHSAGEAGRMLLELEVDIVVINAPLKDEFGTEFAMDLAEKENVSVLLMVRQEQFEQVSYRVEEYGVLTLARPCNSQQTLQAMKLLLATRKRFRVLAQKTATLEEKMAEVRLVTRAKSMLMERMNMSEQEAHRYLEKAAMDNSMKKSVLAQNIIDNFEKNS